MNQDIPMLISNVTLILVTLIAAAVSWNKDNMLAKIIRIVRPSWHETGKCPKCRKRHKAEHHKL